MSGETDEAGRVGARLDALERFGFARHDMDEFLEAYEGGAQDRLDWLEERRETASEIEDRIVALAQVSPVQAKILSPFRDEIYDPFSVEDVYAMFEREMRNVVSWEPPLNRHKHSWFGSGYGESWALLYRRLAALDPSSVGSVEPLYALFDQPERYDEIFRLLQTVEADEARQRAVVEQAVTNLNHQGYDVTGVEGRPLLDALNVLDLWQNFHSQREQVRLSIAQLIEPFDKTLALEFEQRCATIQHMDRAQDLRDLQQEINTLAQALEIRRRDLSDVVQTWRQQGIVFPHEGDLHPKELMEWEANHDVIAQSVNVHLALVERWKRFEMYWPTRAAASSDFIGHLEQTEALQDAVDELDALWKKAELDALDILQSYENEGLQVDAWRRQVFEDPLNALEHLVARSDTFNQRVSLKRQLLALDVSFSGSEDVDVRLQLLSAEDVGGDVLDEVEAFVQRMEKRNERHRVMLDEELAAMRVAGTLTQDIPTTHLSLHELERHVSGLQRHQSTPGGSKTVVLESVLQSLRHEINVLQEQGWNVDDWMEQLSATPLIVAQSLSRARSYMEEHDALRRRLQRLPWGRDVALAAQVELDIKRPSRLEHLTKQIPKWTTHLAQREVEQEGFVLSVWQPQPSRPTLLPVPESMGRPVLQPTNAMEDAHEAMLEAMDESPVSQNVGVVEPATPIVSIEPKTAVAEPAENEEQPVEQHEEVNHVEPSAESQSKEEVFEPQEIAVTPQASTEPVSNEGTVDALNNLSALLAAMGLTSLATMIDGQGLEVIGDVRRGLAQHVNVEPRDVRVARLLRLTLRLLPEGNSDDAQRAALLATLTSLIPPLKRWMRRRLEARHSGAKGHFLDDAKELGTALQRIPGLGKHVPLNNDTWPLPQEVEGLVEEVHRLQLVVQLPSAGGVQA